MKTIGVIGLGSIGLRHAKNLTKLGHHVVGYDPDKSVGEKYNCNSIDEMLIMPVDAFVIASPTETHFNTIAKCKIKPLFVEKPIGGRGTPITNNVLMVGYNLRFHACVQVAKEWLANGLIGKPVWANFVCSQYNNRPDYLRDGVVLNWSHEIDLALYLLGPAAMATSSTRLTNGYDDMTDICLIHNRGGCRTTVHLDYLTAPEIRQGIIVGSDATIIIDLLNRQAWLRGRAGIMLDHFAVKTTFDDDYVDEMKNFVDRLDGKLTLGCTADEAVDALRICNAVRVQAGLF